MDYYPVFLNIRNKRCVVCGGGSVAYRKVKALLDCGANVEVISPVSCPELENLAEEGRILLQSREYREGDLQGAFVVVASTDDKETNRRIATEGRCTGCVVNAVDDAESSDFIVPSVLTRGDITIAVSTSGRSPALARKLRTSLEEQIGDEYAVLAQVVSEVRQEIRQQQLKISEDSWQEALDLQLLSEMIRGGNREEVKSMIIRKLGGGIN